MRRRTGWRLLLCGLGFVACSGGAPRIADCDPEPGLTPFCGFQNPEDLVILPGGDWLLASQMAAPGRAPGSLVAIPINRPEPVVLYPSQPGASLPASHARVLGDPACPGPPDPERFAPHGLDLAGPSFQPPLLLVVNHGGREAVEFFEVGFAGGAPALWWRGCAELPIVGWPNDVAALPDGGFVVTRMFNAVEGLAFLPDALRIAMGWPTGSVLEWTPDDGWREIDEIPAVGPNGIEVSLDGSLIYVASWGSGEVYTRSREGDDTPQAIAVGPHPDNLSWSTDGRLLVTSQVGGIAEISLCARIEAGVCAIPFQVDAIDPETRVVTRRFEHDAGSGMGFATVAVEHGGGLFLGTAAGDRIARAALSPTP